MNKFGFAAIVASGLTASILGAAGSILATASAEAMPVAELPGYSTGADRNQPVSVIQPVVTIPQADTTVRQSR